MKQVKLALVLGVMITACKSREAQPQAGAPADSAAAQPLAPQLRLTMADGQVFDLAEQHGKVVALFFGYTHCPDFCPTTMADFASVKRRLGARADSVRFVFVTVDPKRDTPQRTEQYAHGFDRTFIGLSGDSAQLAEVQRGFHVASFIEQDSTTAPGNYGVGHSALVFLIDQTGHVANTILPGSGRADWLYNSIEQLMRG
jgi:protein SCO1/2